MAQSINTKVEYTGKGVSYLGVGGKVENFFLAIVALNSIMMLMWNILSKFLGLVLLK